MSPARRRAFRVVAGEVVAAVGFDPTTSRV
jgi:hypothetical protein